jgi:hypothetical protein
MGDPIAFFGKPVVIACTIIARNYLARARVLARSFLGYHPDGRFYALIVDGLPAGVAAGEGISVVSLPDLDCPNIREMCFKYDVTELCTALKPTLLQFLFRDPAAASVIYLDPDILITRRMSEATQALENATILLTPHLLKPYPIDGQSPTELDLLACGAYNLGFLGLRRCDEADSFLQWWAERLRDGCLLDPGGRHFVDQKWVDYAPSFFPGTTILRDETYNVAMWNLHARTLCEESSRYLVDGRPLTFFHFSGFGVGGWDLRLQRAPRIEIVEGSPLADILTLYGRLLEENGDAACRNWEYGYSRFSNGAPIQRPMRRLYLSLAEKAREDFPDPFSADRAESFFEWALTPNTELANLSPFLVSVYRLRPDVMAVFPEVFGAHREAFLEWARTSGSQEMDFDPWMVRTESPGRPVGEHGADGEQLEIAGVSLSTTTPDDLLGRWIDLPRKGQRVERGAIAVTGWVLGRHEPVESIEIVGSDTVVGSGRVNIGRPEVAAANPGVFHAAQCGFRVLVALRNGLEGELIVQAVIGQGRRVPIAVIRMTANSRQA